MLTYLLIAVSTLVVVAAAWRLASHRHTIPCPVWLSWMVELDNPFAKTNRAVSIVEHLRVAKGMTVLDLGCGPGRVTIPIARAVGDEGKVVAVDLQQGMLDRARQKAGDQQLSNIEFIHAAAGDGKLGLDKYDRAVLVTVLGEIPDRLTALQEMYAALKQGGILSITEIIFDPHFQSRNSVTKLAEQVGFKAKEFFGNRLAYTLNLEK